MSEWNKKRLTEYQKKYYDTFLVFVFVCRSKKDIIFYNITLQALILGLYLFNMLCVFQIYYAKPKV